MVVLGAQRQATMENDKLECFPRLSDISNVNESTTSEFSTINAHDIGEKEKKKKDQKERTKSPNHHHLNHLNQTRTEDQKKKGKE